MIRTLPLVFVLTSSSALAADVDFEGFYRARMRLFDTLSLNRTLSDSEGLAFQAQHRLWLKPTFHAGEAVTLHAELRGLDGVVWGTQPGTLTDASGNALVTELGDTLDAPTSTSDPRVALTDFSLWRAWGQVDTEVGRFTFGRMPLRWGSGVWQNDGLGWNADYGDTADRISWEKRFDDVYLQVAFDTNAERLVNAEDDTMSFNAAAAYEKERYLAGLLIQYRRTSPSGQSDGSQGLDLFTADLAGQAELGPLSAQVEFVGQFGRGSLGEGINDAAITAGGGVLDAALQFGDDLQVGLLAGAATGDSDSTDAKFHTFTFDRDYNVGFILFEQPMPTLAEAVPTEAGGGRNLALAQSGTALGNALFLRPRAKYDLPKNFSVNAGIVLARAWSAPTTGRVSYGQEVDVGVAWKHSDRFEFNGAFGMFIPGSYYRNFSDETHTGFTAPVFAGQIIGEVRF